MNNIVIISE